MKVIKSQGHLQDISFSSILFEHSLFIQVEEEFTTTNKSHDEIDLEFSLETEFHTKEEGMIDSLKDFFLGNDRLNLAISDDNILS